MYHLDINFDDNLDLTDNGILLFHAENVLPGDSFFTDITITNHTELNVDFAIDDIRVDNLVFQGTMLYQFFDQTGAMVYGSDNNFAHDFGVLAPGETRTYKLKSTLKHGTTNVIQGQSAWFTFVFRVFSDMEEEIDVPKTGMFFFSEMTSQEVCSIISLLLIVLAVVYVMFRRWRKRHSSKMSSKKKSRTRKKAKPKKKTTKKKTTPKKKQIQKKLTKSQSQQRRRKK